MNSTAVLGISSTISPALILYLPCYRVAHPALAKIAKDVFDRHMPTDNQINIKRDYITVSESDLLNVACGGQVSTEGVRSNLEVALRYTESWLRGQGCLAIHHLMEDAATAEVSRSQVWQWARHSVTTKEGVVITGAYNVKILEAVYADLVKQARPGHKFAEALRYLREIVTGKYFPEFITRFVPRSSKLFTNKHLQRPLRYA
jgi:malate synthase